MRTTNGSDFPHRPQGQALDASKARALQTRIDIIDDEQAEDWELRQICYWLADVLLDQMDERATIRFQLMAALAKVEARLAWAARRRLNGKAAA